MGVNPPVWGHRTGSPRRDGVMARLMLSWAGGALRCRGGIYGDKKARRALFSRGGELQHFPGDRSLFFLSIPSSFHPSFTS